jgi:hypothetical protein
MGDKRTGKKKKKVRTSVQEEPVLLNIQTPAKAPKKASK